MAPLGAVGSSAHRALWAQTHDRHALIRGVQDALHDFFVARGEEVASLPLAVDEADVDAWTQEWRDYLADAGIATKSDGTRLISWLRARGARPVHRGADRSIGKASDLINALEASGVVLSPRQQNEFRAKVKSLEEGEAAEQCLGKRPVGILYLGRALSEDDCTEYDLQYLAMGGASGGVVDITVFESYIKLHNETRERNVVTLERALEREALYRPWLLRTAELLEMAGLPKASLRLIKLDMQVDEQTGNQWARKQAYLKHYFFKEHLGVGLPTTMAVGSFARAMGASLGIPTTSVLPPTPAASTVASTVSLGELRSASQVGSTAESGVESSLSSLRTELAEMRTAIDDRKRSAGKAGLSACTGRSQCDWCRREDCPLMSGDGRPCRQYNSGLELWRKKLKADREKREKELGGKTDDESGC